MPNKTTELRSPKRSGLTLIPLGIFCSENTTDPVTVTNNFDIFCLTTGAKRLFVSTDNMYTYVAQLNRAFIVLLFLSFPHKFINVTVVCHVQHLGNVFVFPNVEAFYLLLSLL